MKPQKIPLLVATACLVLVFVLGIVSNRHSSTPVKRAGGLGLSEDGAGSALDANGPDQSAQGALTASASPSSPASTADKPQVFGTKGPVTMDQIPQGRFRRELAKLSEPSRQAALQKLGQFQIPIIDLRSLHLHKDGSLFYACPAPGGTVPLPPEATAPSQSKVSISSPPACNSRPGSPNTLYIDFSGFNVSGRSWNSSFPLLEAVPYDLDGDRTTFNEFEQKQIVEIWRRVSEDFRTFDINVTTVRPSDLETNTRISHVLITKSTDAKGRTMPMNGAGGVASLAQFNYLDEIEGLPGAVYFSPAFAYYDNAGWTARNLAEVVSHEAGHNFTLFHDGAGEGTEYYGGHGSDQQSWGPIMGASYGRNFTQWTTSNQTYTNANNDQNDIAQIASMLSDDSSGVTGYAPDDVPDTLVEAPSLSVSAGKFATQDYTITGNGTANDVDTHKIVTDSNFLDFVVSSFKIPDSPSSGSNLALKAELLSANGSILQTNESGRNIARISFKTPPGTYYIRVSGVGYGNSTAKNPTGFPADASLGTYSISGTISDATVSSGNSSTVTALEALSVSSGVLSPAVSHRYKITPSPGNQTIQPGQSVALSLNARPLNLSATLQSLAVLPGPAPTPTPIGTPAPAVAPLSVAHSIAKSWGSGMESRLLIKNTSKAAVTNWSVGFEYPSTITQILGGNLSKEIGTRSFVTTVPFETDSLNVDWKTADPLATTKVKLNTGNFTSFTNTGNFALSLGENNIVIEVTAPDTVTTGYHRLTITRAGSLDGVVDQAARLSAISFSAGSVVPSFTNNKSSYAITIPNASTSTSITANKTTADGKIEARIGNGVFFTLKPGSPSAPINLAVGNNRIEVKATSGSGNSSNSYFFTITRNSTGSSLSSLVTRWNGLAQSFTPSFSSNTTSYNATVANSVSSLTVTPAVVEKNSSVFVRVGSGEFNIVAAGNTSIPLMLTAGNNTTIEVKVLSDNDSDSKTYTLNVGRLATPVTSAVGTISLNGTTLTGTIDARSTSAAFQFGTSPTFGTTLPASVATGNGTAPVSTTTSALLPSTAYYYRLASIYGGITDYSDTKTFLTESQSTLNPLFLIGANATGAAEGYKFADFGYPTINNTADTAFHGFLSFTGTSLKGFGGLWTSINGTTRFASSISSSPAGGGLYSGIGEPVLDNLGRTTFVGYLTTGQNGVTSLTSAGIWQVSANGTVSQIIRAGGNATGASGTVFSTFNKLAAGDGGIAFTATLRSSAVNSTNNTGLWAQNTAGSLVLVARTGASPTPTLRNFTIFNAEAGQNSQSRHFNASGDLVLVATFGNSSTGIYRATKSGNFTLNATTPVAAIGSAVPGVTGGKFVSLGNPIINSVGDIAFTASFSGNGVASGNNTGIFRYSSNGTGVLVARTGVSYSGGQTFQSLSSPLLNNAKDIAFTGALVTGGNVTSSNSNGIWTIGSNGTLTKIFRRGDIAPGLVGTTFASFSQLAFPANGGIIFAATLATGSGGVSTTNNQGVWAASTAGANPKLIVRTGNSLSVGAAVKTIFSYDFVSASSVTEGVGRTINSDGDIILKLNFTDKSTGLFRYDTP